MNNVYIVDSVYGACLLDEQMATVPVIGDRLYGLNRGGPWVVISRFYDASADRWTVTAEMG